MFRFLAEVDNFAAFDINRCFCAGCAVNVAMAVVSFESEGKDSRTNHNWPWSLGQPGSAAALGVSRDLHIR